MSIVWRGSTQVINHLRVFCPRVKSHYLNGDGIELSRGYVTQRHTKQRSTFSRNTPGTLAIWSRDGCGNSRKFVSGSV